MTKSFIQISDSHIDDNKLVLGVDSQANLGSIVSMISDQNYDVLLISGDLVIMELLSPIKNSRKYLTLLRPRSTYYQEIMMIFQTYLKFLTNLLCVTLLLVVGKLLP
jgi:3',5'-cyclic AMP phosphodiesterase CpdA